MSASRYPVIEGEVKAVLKNLSGRNLDGIDTSATFFELGFDSLLLTQASQSFRQKFGVKITFRQLLEDLVSIAAVSAYLDEKIPADKFNAAPQAAAKAAPVVAKISTPAPAFEPERATKFDPDTGGMMDRIVKQQLALMARQLDLFRGGSNGAGPIALPELNGAPADSGDVHIPSVDAPEPAKVSAAVEQLTPRYFGPFKPIDKRPGGGLTEQQQTHLDALVAAYVAKTPRSKAYTQKHRARLADPRTVSGFRQTWKEIVYPIVVKQSAGSRLWISTTMSTSMSRSDSARISSDTRPISPCARSSGSSTRAWKWGRNRRWSARSPS